MKLSYSARLSMALALASLCACDDDVTPAPALDAGGQQQPADGATTQPPGELASDASVPSIVDASQGSDASVPNVPALYVGSSRVFDPSGSNGYIFSFGSLDKGTAIDLKQAKEIEDAWVFGDGKPYFFTATLFVPTLQRWTVSADGKLEEGPVLNLTNQGVKGTYSAQGIPMFSAEKSYFLDPPSGQVVVWNPSTMTFIKTLPLDIADMGALEASFDPNIVFRDGKAFVTAYWTSMSSMWTEYAPTARVFAIDTATDTVVSMVDDPHTGSLGLGGKTSNGTIYYAPWDYHATVRSIFGGTYGVASRAVKITAPSLTPDAADVDLSALVGGRPAGSMFLLDDNTALLHVWHNDLVNATPANWAEKRSEPAYFWYRWNIAQNTAEKLPDQQPSVEGGEWKSFDGKVVSYAPDSEYANTTLWQLLPDCRQQELLTVPGWTVNLVRVR